MKLIKKGLVKKVISMLITACLMITIANIPVYAGATAISTVKTTDAVLSKTYITPAQSVKKATATKTTKKTATKNGRSKKTVSLENKIKNKYTKTGLTVFKKIANKLNLSLKTVYNSFVKMGVTKEQIKKISKPFLNMLKRGVDIVNCASLAVAKFLGISTNLAALQNLAADISKNADLLVKDFSKENDLIGTYDGDEKVLRVNGYKNASWVNDKFSLKEFTNNSKKGTKAIFYVECYGDGGHAITVQKLSNNKFAVYDINVNNGNKVIYTKAKFEKLMKGSSYYKATDALYKGKISILVDTTKVISSYAKKLANKGVSIINNILKNKGLNQKIKTWLENAKTLINNVLNGGKTFSEKEAWLKKAYSALETILNQKASIVSLVKQTVSGVFSSLKNILKKDVTYKMYTKYGESGTNLVSAISNKYNLSHATIYNIFVKNGVTKSQIEDVSNSIICDIKNGYNIFSIQWGPNYLNIEKSLEEIEELLNK